MIEENVWEGVQSLLDNYAHVQAGDRVVLLYTSDSYESAAWVSAALELRSIACQRVWMAPLQDDGFPQRLEAALPRLDELPGRLVVLTFERDTMSHSAALARALCAYDRTRYTVLRSISASPNLFADTLRVHPTLLSALNTAILERLMHAQRLRISTPSGSDLQVGLDAKHRWISNRGSARPGAVVVLPAGEVATFPASISGVFVADFAFNVNAITERDARLGTHPVTVWIEGGRAVRHECSDTAMSSFLTECFQTYCAYNVGELGFGTNYGVGNAIALNSHINERRRGVHLGFGQHNQDPNVVGYQCLIHLDLIARGGTIWVDDDPRPLDLEALAPSASPHPTTPRDEDVFSPELGDIEVDDCCGILTSDGLKLFTPPPS
jgi:hypothetical protein